MATTPFSHLATTCMEVSDCLSGMAGVCTYRASFLPITRLTLRTLFRTFKFGVVIPFLCSVMVEKASYRREPTRQSQKCLVFPTPKSGAAVLIKIALGSGLA